MQAQDKAGFLKDVTKDGQRMGLRPLPDRG